MNKIAKFISIFFLSLTSISFAMAQTKAEPEMATLLRSNGKIYVVVASCVIILFGLFIYMYLVDKRISKLEKKED